MRLFALELLIGLRGASPTGPKWTLTAVRSVNPRNGLADYYVTYVYV